MDIKLPVGTCQLSRCDDSFFRKARAMSMPIWVDDMMSACLLWHSNLGLPQVYSCLTRSFGPSGKLYDDWKGAFAFPFKLTVTRGEDRFKYLLMLRNMRSSVTANIWRVMKPGETYDRAAYHAPFEAELSKADLLHVLAHVLGYLEGYFETMPKWDTPFLKEVQSNGILYGYSASRGDFFEEQHESESRYSAALAAWRMEIAPEPSAELREELEW